MFFIDSNYPRIAVAEYQKKFVNIVYNSERNARSVWNDDIKLITTQYAYHEHRSYCVLLKPHAHGIREQDIYSVLSWVEGGQVERMDIGGDSVKCMLRATIENIRLGVSEGIGCKKYSTGVVDDIKAIEDFSPEALEQSLTGATYDESGKE